MRHQADNTPQGCSEHSDVLQVRTPTDQQDN